MSIPEIPPPVPPPPKRGLGGCMMAFLIVLGVVMLLPGLCSLALLASIGGSVHDAGDALLWGLAFAITIGGIALIVVAVRNR
ncbi:MAG TPA: hypothetical protein VK438_01430 [Xanthobacteraceae bacterium]|nr:hypothetical protein [Xanthobacteraceae bacterium]